MSSARWILVVEPNESALEIILSEAAYCMGSGIEIVCVSFVNELVATIMERGTLPEVLIVEWFASGNQVRICLESLRKLGLLNKMRIIAMAGSSARAALLEAQNLGVRRFVCKHPDETAFRKKISEAIREFVQAAHLSRTA